MLIAQNMESPQPPFPKGEKTIGIIIAKYTVQSPDPALWRDVITIITSMKLEEISK